MKVLIALDGSPCSERALEFVRRVRWPAGSRMLVLSVLETARGASPLPERSGAARRDARWQRREAVVAAAQRALRAAGFATQTHVVAGEPREVLVAWAERERIDLVVVGSRGRTGLARLLLGSVSSRVVERAPCAVLVVKGTDG